MKFGDKEHLKFLNQHSPRKAAVKTLVEDTIREHITDWQELAHRAMNDFPGLMDGLSDDERFEKAKDIVSEATTELEEKHNYYI